MAEDKASGKLNGWIKAILTSVMGLCSGAILMYISPLVNSAIKPAKPVANFGFHAEGLHVTFQNRSTGGADGWWDFGDGSPLEPFSPNQETVAHTFPSHSNYSVKLSLRNFLGEENDRTVTVDLAGGNGGPPVIEAFKVESMKRRATAPATFKLASQVKNADMCILYVGDDRPMEVTTDSSFERHVTLKEPGRYSLRVVAVSGKHVAEKTETVVVGETTAGAPTASLQVTYQAVHVERKLKEVNFHVAFPADHKEHSYPFKLVRTEPGELIADAKFAATAKESNVKNPALTISPDKTKVTLTGELTKSGGVMALQKNAPPIHWTPTVLLTLERRSEPTIRATDPISFELNVPGVTDLTLPKISSHWEIKQTVLHLELLDGNNVVFRDKQLPPAGKLVQFKGHPYHLTVTQESDHIRVELVDAKATLRLTGN